VRLLLFVSGRGLGVFCRFCAGANGCFLTVDTGCSIEVRLLGVAAGVETFALTLLFPGAVIDSLLEGTPNLFGVAGIGCGAPSLVDGLLPLLLDMADPGRTGGAMLLSALKKLDRRRPLPGAGDDGSWDRLSMVLSESDGRLFLFSGFTGLTGLDESSMAVSACSDSGSLSRNPALELAREDAREADLKPSRLPSVSSSLAETDEDDGRDAFVWREGGRANGRLKTGASLVLGATVEVRREPKLGIPLTRREEGGAMEDRLEAELSGAGFGAVKGLLE
jgi:hypothetical protein